MSAEAAAETTNDPTIEEPTALRALAASIEAVVTKESRWRMRGRRAFAILTVYVSLLALLVFIVYQSLYDQGSIEFTPQGDVIRSDAISATVSASIGQAVFSAILIIQTLLLVLLAPALSSGSISMEREKGTLELLITTPVSTLGMVIGKLISSLAYVFLLTAASVPLMSIVFVFGGVAPDDIVRAYVVLCVIAIGIGSVGLFMSALTKRTQIATALTYLVVLALTIGSLALHSYIHVTSERDFRGAFETGTAAPEALLWLNPLVADADVLCTAIPESFGFACSYTAMITGQPFDPAAPPRDLFWPRSALAFLVLAAGLTLVTTQLIAPSRRFRRQRLPALAPDVPSGPG